MLQAAAYTRLVDFLSYPPQGGGEGGALLPGAEVPDGPVDKLQEVELGMQLQAEGGRLGEEVSREGQQLAAAVLRVVALLRAEAGLREVDLAEPVHQSGHQLVVAVTEGGWQWLGDRGDNNEVICRVLDLPVSVSIPLSLMCISLGKMFQLVFNN